MTDLFDVRGLVPIFHRASLDISEALLLSPDEKTTITIEKRMRPFIIGCLDVLRQQDIYTSDIDDVVEFEYLVEKTILDILTESEDGMALTAEEMCNAVKCGILEVFGQAIAGTESNTGIAIQYDENGNPVLVDGGLGSLSGGGINQSLSKMGAMEFVETKLQEYIEDFEDFYLSEAGDEAAMVAFLEAKYKTSADITSAVTSYKAHRVATNPAPQSSLSGLDRQMYCFGATKQIASAWVIDDAISDKSLRLEMISGLTDEQLSDWSQQLGYESQDYVNSPCFRYEPFEMTLQSGDMAVAGFDRTINLSAFLHINRKYKLEISASFQHDTNGKTSDGVYVKDGQVYTYYPPRLALSNNSSTITPDVQPDVSLSGYTVIYSNNGTRETLGIQLGSPAGEWSGTVSIKFTDLGSAI